ncbi:hypothetical protein H5410_037482, partial [Solanum commersonii]
RKRIYKCYDFTKEIGLATSLNFVRHVIRQVVCKLSHFILRGRIRILQPICSFRQCGFLVFLCHQLFCLFESFNQLQKAFLCVFFHGVGHQVLCNISRALQWLELKMQRVRGFKFANSNQDFKTGYLLAADTAPTAGVKFCFTQHLVGLLNYAE